MRVFLKASHHPAGGMLIVMSAGAYITLLVPLLIIFSVSYPWFLIGALLIIAVTIPGVRFVNSIGLYVDHKTIYYKTLSKKKINPDEIIAIRVTTTMFQGRFSSATEMTDADGNKLLSMFFLNGFDPGMQSQAGCDKDSYFLSEYKKFIICDCVYDQSVIDYLLTLNPNIIVS